MCISIVGCLLSPTFHWTSVFPRAIYEKIHLDAAKLFLPRKIPTSYAYVWFQYLPAVLMGAALF